MQNIKAWLKDGSYEVGVNLYQHYGNNSFLKKQFAKEKSAFNEHKLREELMKIAATEPVMGAESVDQPVKPLHKFIYPKDFNQNLVTPPPVTDIDRSELNKKYLQLVKRKDRLYMELNVHMEQKHHLPEGFLLQDCAKSILTTHQAITETFALIDHYQVHQKFPEEIKPAPKPDIDPEKEIQLLRSSISKGNKRLLNPNCRDRKKTEDLLKSNQERLSVLVANRNK